jgi:hypothetical protein
MSARTVTVRKGDTIRFGSITHAVRAVVPADAAKNVVGWVELDPDPAPVAESR